METRKVEFTRDFTYDTIGGKTTIKAGTVRTVPLKNGKAVIVIGHGIEVYADETYYKII